MVWEVEDKSLRSEFVRSWSRRNLVAGNCVMHVSLGGEHCLYLPERSKGSNPDFVFGTLEEKVSVVHFPESISCFT